MGFLLKEKESGRKNPEEKEGVVCGDAGKNNDELGKQFGHKRRYYVYYFSRYINSSLLDRNLPIFLLLLREEVNKMNRSSLFAGHFIQLKRQCVPLPVSISFFEKQMAWGRKESEEDKSGKEKIWREGGGTMWGRKGKKRKTVRKKSGKESPVMLKG